MCTSLFFEHLLLTLLGIYLGMELLGHINSMFNFLKSHQTVFYHFISLPANVQKFQLLYILTNIFTYFFRISSRHEVVSHCDFGLHFPNN